MTKRSYSARHVPRRRDEKPVFPGFRVDQLAGLDGIFVRVAGPVFENDPLGRNSRRFEKSTNSRGTTWAPHEDFRRAAREDDLRVRKGSRNEHGLGQSLRGFVED